MYKWMLPQVVLMAGLLLIPSAARSQEGVSGFIALGAGVAPEYEGANEYEPIPFAVGSIEYRGYSATIRGPRVDFDLVPNSDFAAGPILNFRGGRDDDVEDDRVSLLDEIDGAFEIGGFVAWTPSLGLAEGDRAELTAEILQDVSDAHGGLIAAFSTGYSFQATDRLRLSADVSVSVATDDYADTYFSVDAAAASRSGLQPFNAGGGARDAGIGLGATYSLSDSWGLTGRAGYSRLLGDAADSPITDDAGAANQFFTGLGVVYRF